MHAGGALTPLQRFILKRQRSASPQSLRQASTACDTTMTALHNRLTNSALLGMLAASTVGIRQDRSTGSICSRVSAPCHLASLPT